MSADGGSAWGRFAQTYSEHDEALGEAVDRLRQLCWAAKCHGRQGQSDDRSSSEGK